MKRSLLLLVVVTVVIGLAGCDLLGKKDIKYEVAHSEIGGAVKISYEDENGDCQEISNYLAFSTWTYSFTVNRVASAIVVYVSAENNQGSGTVTVSILEDGTTIREVTAADFAEAAAVIE